MSIIEHGSGPAGWYPDRADGQRLRWWTGTGWTDEVRPLLIDTVPDFGKGEITIPEVRAVIPLFAPPVVPAAPQPVDHEALAPVYDITDRLAPTPERSTPAPDPHLATPATQPEPALTRRQLREQLGGPLTVGSTGAVDTEFVGTTYGDFMTARLTLD